MESLDCVKKDYLWTIFVPYKILVLPSSSLYGKVDRRQHRIYVLGLTKSNESQSMSQEVIGEWLSDTCIRRPYKSSKTKQNMWLAINKTDTGQINCELLIETMIPNVNCILYDPHLLIESFFSLSSVSLETNDMMRPLITHSQCIDSASRDHRSKMSLIGNIQVSSLFLRYIAHLYSIVTLVVDNRYTQGGYLKNIVEIPAINQHLINKKKIVKAAIKSKRQEPFRSQNIATMTLLDMILGFLIMVMLMKSGFIYYFSVQFFVWTEKVANELDTLLNWLMGAPAGLKLNKPLTEFLGHFFMYHIYLWKGYLHLLKPVFSTVLWCSSCVGVLGLSAQISLLQDIVSLTTLHVYCYYVYAARLYRLQVYVLSSLWRLFRGKKWNVLRHRVDSASFDVDQLFVGTLLFTIFLFLLPTTALYYTVFTMLRMVVLVFQGCLSTFVYIMNHVPLFSIALWIKGSPKVYGEVSLEPVKPDVQSKCIIYTLQIQKVGFGDLLKLSSCKDDGQSESKLSWKHFLLNLLKGHLVYPWIDLHK